MKFVANWIVYSGDRSIWVEHLIEAEDEEEAGVLAEKMTKINNFWDYPDFLWEFDHIDTVEDCKHFEDRESIERAIKELEKNEGKVFEHIQTGWD